MAHTPVDPSTTPAPDGVLDASRGPLHPLARATLQAAVEAAWADPTRRHAPGRAARAHLDTARGVLAGALGVAPAQLSVHASAEEALALGLAGLRHARRRVGGGVLLGAVERSVLLLEAGEDPVPVDRVGRVDRDAWRAGLQRPGLAAAAVQTANGEVGTRQPVPALATAARDAGVPLLVDASASLGRDPLGPEGEVLVADAASFGGPPLGLLAVRPGARWSLPGPRREAEHGRALAPPWVPLVLAAAEAWRQTEAAAPADAAQARALVDDLREAAARVPDVQVAGDPLDRLPHVVTFSALFTDGEALVEELARRGLVVASGSACASSVLRASHVLTAMGVLSHGNVRVVLPLLSVAPDRAASVARLCAELPDAVHTVRRRMGTAEL
ncbi:aminotransferase class V-fold PLP-dependent enzyme [Phycicoccus endophyticus]|uniref:aminotransferase class V-fold PLP-dependent enzyme n=1 Tax=Phycicoccus endophyticus TaxID=1690220 RepID=UPI001E4AD10B|nr:aminotransferase class V-fold PLP-dependent enzyme [Phycicoccus endophyticus]